MRISLAVDAFDMGTTNVENIFLDEFLPYAEALEIKVYLLGLRMLQQRPDVDLKLLAERLDEPLERIIEAYRSWQDLGLIDLKGDHLRYRSLRSIYLESNYVLKKGLVSPDFGPYYQEIFRRVNNLLNLELQENERLELITFLSDKEIDPEVVAMAFEESRTAKLRTRLAIEKLRYWLENEVQTLDDVLVLKERFNLRQKNYRDVLHALGNPYDHPSLGDRECIDQWLDVYGFDMDQILEKIREVTRNKRNPSMNYLDAVFRNEFEGKSAQGPSSEIDAHEELKKLFRKRS